MIPNEKITDVVQCDDNNPCTNDYCDPTNGCIHQFIPDCIPCGPNSCTTIDKCIPLLFTHPDPCIIGICENGQCKFEELEICGSGEPPMTTIVSTIATTTYNPTTSSITSGTTSGTTGISSTTLSSGRITTIASTIVSTIATSTGSTTSVYDPCSNHKCPLGSHCFNIRGEAICKKTTCLSCDDLNCHSRNLKCISIKQDLPNPCQSDNCFLFTIIILK